MVFLTTILLFGLSGHHLEGPVLVDYVDYVELNTVVRRTFEFEQIIFWDFTRNIRQDKIVAYRMVNIKDYLNKIEKDFSKNRYFISWQDRTTYRVVFFNFYKITRTIKDPERENVYIFAVGDRRGLKKR